MDFFTAPSPAAPSTLTWRVLLAGSTTRRTKLKEEEHNLSPRSSRAVSKAEMSRSPLHLRKTLRRTACASSVSSSARLMARAKTSAAAGYRFSPLLTLLTMYRTAWSQSNMIWKSMFARQ